MEGGREGERKPSTGYGRGYEMVRERERERDGEFLDFVW